MVNCIKLYSPHTGMSHLKIILLSVVQQGVMRNLRNIYFL